MGKFLPWKAENNLAIFHSLSLSLPSLPACLMVFCISSKEVGIELTMGFKVYFNLGSIIQEPMMPTTDIRWAVFAQ